MNYTKGKWKVDGFRIFDTNGHSVATTGTFSGRKYEEDIANAYLIASAPDLYEALKDLVGICEEFFFEDQLEQANKAIAKAESK
jgi:hypothetical protein